MRLPPRDRKASRLYDEYGIYLQVRLEADPRCRDLAAKWTAAQGRLLAPILACSEAKAEAMRALAVRDEADLSLGQQVRLLHRAIAVLVRNNSRSSLMQTYFPQGSPAVTDVRPRLELEMVETLCAKLGNESEPLIVAHRDPLHAAFASCQAAVAAHEAAVEAARTAQGVEHAARIDWFGDYEALFHDLRSRFVKQPAQAVEAFFHSYRKAAARQKAASS